MRVIPALFASIFAFTVPGPAGAAPVSIDDVRGMALDKGIVKIEEVELDDGVWEVEGYDANGHEIEMEVDAATGNIIKLKRD
jgi:uncharacterized membrane protein YkoI